jgi:hypothetical protein
VRIVLKRRDVLRAAPSEARDRHAEFSCFRWHTQKRKWKMANGKW